jgi:hypothetical protein
MHYAIHEGTFDLPDAALDRTVNMLVMNVGPGGLSLVISRGRLRDGEDTDAFIAREWTLATREMPQLTERSRRAVTIDGRPGVQIEATLEQDGTLRHQMQTIFPAGDAGQMLVMTLTCAAPFTDEQRALAEQMLASYRFRAPEPARAADAGQAS